MGGFWKRLKRTKMGYAMELAKWMNGDKKRAEFGRKKFMVCRELA
jgi:hypothetical protein